MLQHPPRSMESDLHWKTALLLAIALLLWCAGCNDTCFVFVSSPGTGTVIIGGSNPGAACGFAKPQSHATVQVVAHVVRVCEGCSDSNQVRSVFVSLSGIDLRARPDAEQQSSDWHKLLPAFDAHPLQVDLMDPNAIAPVPLNSRTEVPAGTYDFVRLRFATNQQYADVPQSELNFCGAVGPNCVVMGDGRITTVRLDDAASELLIPLEASTGVDLFVMPDSNNELLIELTPVWSVAVPSGEAVRFLPSLMGRAKLERKIPQ